jgi:hypothetical protein
MNRLTDFIIANLTDIIAVVQTSQTLLLIVLAFLVGLRPHTLRISNTKANAQARLRSFHSSNRSPLSTIIKADMILVLDHRQIVERGKHNELMAKQGFYYNLYMSQFKK